MSPAWQRTQRDRVVYMATCTTTLPRDMWKTPQLTITGLCRSQPKDTAQVEDALAGGQDAPEKDETTQGQHLLTWHLWRDTHQPEHQHRGIGSLGNGPALCPSHVPLRGGGTGHTAPRNPPQPREPSPAPQHPLTTQRGQTAAGCQGAAGTRRWLLRIIDVPVPGRATRCRAGSLTVQGSSEGENATL